MDALEHCRRVLRSDATLVAVEAAAGCGKTHEAVSAAVDLARDLPRGREVLLLAHTNAAVQVFKRRVWERRARVRAMTLDAFALELLAPYAKPLGLGHPLRMDGPDATPFAELAPRVVELFHRAPTVLKCIAGHYPVVLFDEHQDARWEQHRIAELLAGIGGCRVRLLGDPMQAIFDFDAGEMPNWDAAVACCDKAELHNPQRWKGAPGLGDWILHARGALVDGNPLPLCDLPKEVAIVRLAELSDLHRYSKQPPREAMGVLNSVLRRDGTVGILARHKSHVRGIHRAIGRRVPIHEGSDMTRASGFLERALQLEGQPRALALLLVDLIRKTSAGCDKQFQRSINNALGHHAVNPGRQQKLRPFLERLGLLYESPTAVAWCTLAGHVVRRPPTGVRIDEPGALYTLGSLRKGSGDLRELLASTARVRRNRTRLPPRCITTIHKAKGEEFDHVVIMNCGRTPFPNDDAARRLMYVAISRACQSLTLIVPGSSGSPLVSEG